MVYLIDDKKSRQSDYGWNDDKFASYSEILYTIRNIEELCSLQERLFLTGNVVLFHESFSLSVEKEKKQEIEAFEQRLASEETNIYVARFSGSKFSRWVEGNSCMLPPSFLYVNLEVFLKKHIEGDTNFMYLAYGKDYEIEKTLADRIRTINKNEDNVKFPPLNVSGKYFFFLTYEEPINVPFTNPIIDEKWEHYFSKDTITDANLQALVTKCFSEERYDCIFLPLCFGDSLSDYLGLRLAMLIKFSNTPNKYVPIIIYGEVNIFELQNNDCFDILKMTGVYLSSSAPRLLVDVSKKAVPISAELYRKELEKIHLPIPSNIGDNHSIANRWGVYRWSKVLDDTDEIIEKISIEIPNSLYFKYLAALYPPSQTTPIKEEDIYINKIIPELNILYVDDEADEGWYELLCHLFCDINDISDFDYLGDELKSKSQDEIIDIVMETIKKNKKINLVILDLRLHPDDFSSTIISDITGYKLLDKIKKYNRGIQVLVFSATNKIWNLQALQAKGVDGFLMKEAPQNSAYEDYTYDSISNFIKLINNCSNHLYKKELWPRIQKLNTRIKYLSNFNDIGNKYANNLLTLLKMAEDVLFDIYQEHSLDYAFIHLFSIIELTANEWIDKKKIPYGFEYFFKEDGAPLRVIDSKSKRPGKELKGIPSWSQKIANTLCRVNTYDDKVAELVDKRNDYTHPEGSLTFFSVEDVEDVFEIVEKIINNIKES